MKKIPSVFERDWDGDRRRVLPVVVPGCEWALSGEAVATLKWDGTACLVRGGVLYKRYDAKPGKTPPDGWEPCEDAPDEKSGHWPGWVPVGEGPEDRWHREARGVAEYLPDGTYELLGPKVGGNPEHRIGHELMPHGAFPLPGLQGSQTFESIRDFLAANEIEGIVWHHPDGRMAKIKRSDFGLPWPIKAEEGRL